MFEQQSKWKENVQYVGLFLLELLGDEYHVIELIKKENSNLCRQPAVEDLVQVLGQV